MNAAGDPAYDALLLVSFGGPEGPDDVLPFLRNVTAGRGIPDERLAAVAEHYYHFGGVSPINEQNRELLAAVRADLAAHGPELAVYWGNRNWAPYLTDAVAEMAAGGVRRALAFVTSAYGSYSACRQYQQDIAAACAAVGADAPTIEKIRHYFNHPGFIEPTADGVRAALAGMPAGSQLICTAHSIPMAMARTSGPAGDLYVTELTEAAGLVAAAGAPDVPWELAWQSRSGSPRTPWLGPDVRDRIRALAADGVPGVVVSPVGFVSDHLEVAWDLDVEAAATAREGGIAFARAGTAGTDPRFVSMVRELVLERTTAGCPRRALGVLGPSYDTCPVGCCPLARSA
ncbi:MAG: ferrochelatase [Mycobacteriales bacterium]